MDSGSLVQPLSANVAEPSLVVHWLGPAMSDRILDHTWRNTGARRDHVRHTLLMYDEVANCRVTQLTLLLLNRYKNSFT